MQTPSMCCILTCETAVQRDRSAEPATHDRSVFRTNHAWRTRRRDHKLSTIANNVGVVLWARASRIVG